MHLNIEDLAEMSIEEAAKVIKEAAAEKKRAEKEEKEKSWVVSTEMFRFGAEVVYTKERAILPAVVIGYSVSEISENEKITHGELKKSYYLLKYPNGCSSYVLESDVYPNKRVAVEAMINK